jgi:hypothetical protein
VRSTQIAQTGCLVGTLRALYNDGRYGEDITVSLPAKLSGEGDRR